jgi:hypothetical protein
MIYNVSPKRTNLLVARIADCPEKPVFAWDVPANDAELAAIVGNDTDGTPKLTFAALAQEMIATRLQAVFSLKLAEDAARDADKKFTLGQHTSQEQRDAWQKESYAKAYSLLVGEREAASGRKSADAKAQEKIDADNQDKISKLRAQAIAAPTKSRPVFIQMAEMFGYTELAAELAAL